MQKAVIYTRVSTDEQANNNLSLKGQEDAARKFCADNNITVVAHYSDRGESAKTTKRPALLSSLEYCRENSKTIDYYFVWKMDRLARNAEDHMFIRALLKKHGIQLQSITEPLEDNPTGRLMELILAGYSQFDNEVRAERSTNGILRRLEEGGWPHFAPLGYINIKDSLGRPTIKPDSTAPLLREWLLTYLLNEYSMTYMHRLARESGIKTRAGKQLSYMQCTNILRNPIYAGLVKTSMLESPVTGLHDPLITIEQYAQIQLKLDGKTRPVQGISSANTWPLRNGFLTCSDCNGKITGSSSKGRSKHYDNYHCIHCKAKSVGHRVSNSRNSMHDEFELFLEQIKPTEAHIKLFKSIFLRKWNIRHKEELGTKQRLSGELGQLEQRKQKIMEMYIDDKLTTVEKEQQLQNIESDLVRITLKLNQLNHDVADGEQMIDFAMRLIDDAPKLWRNSDSVNKQLLQKHLFPNGLEYSFTSGFGTAKTNELYLSIKKATSDEVAKSNVVGVVDSNWNQIVDYLKDLYTNQANITHITSLTTTTEH